MTWIEFDWSYANGGTQGVQDRLSDALFDHPAWEFVEERRQVMSVPWQTAESGPYEYYDMLACDFQVWRCKGTVNRLGADFYIFFGAVVETNQNVTNYVPNPIISDSGIFFLFGGEGYDPATGYVHNQIGKGWYSGGETAVSADGIIGNGMDYPIWEARWEDDEQTVFGTWSNPNRTSFQGPPGSPMTVNTDHSSGITNGSPISFSSYRLDVAPGNAPTDIYNVNLRVTKQGILFIVHDPASSGRGDEFIQYIGGFDQSNVPEALKLPVPIMSIGPSVSYWSSSQTQDLLAMPRIKGVLEGAYSSYYFFSSTYTYGYGYYDSAPTTGDRPRDQFVFPGLEEYVVVPWGLVPGRSGTLNYQGWYVSLYNVPGLWMVSGDAAPEDWNARDTMTSPDGVECLLMVGGYNGDTWFLVDPEID